MIENTGLTSLLWTRACTVTCLCIGSAVKDDVEEDDLGSLIL